jgi:hypothetical protein
MLLTCRSIEFQLVKVETCSNENRVRVLAEIYRKKKFKNTLKFGISKRKYENKS